MKPSRNITAIAGKNMDGATGRANGAYSYVIKNDRTFKPSGAIRKAGVSDRRRYGVTARTVKVMENA